MSNRWVSKDKSNKLNLHIAVPITIEAASRVSLMVLLEAKAMVDTWSHQWLPISHFHLAMFATDVKSPGIISKIARLMPTSPLTPTKVRVCRKSISGREISGSVLRNSLKTSLKSSGRSWRRLECMNLESWDPNYKINQTPYKICTMIWTLCQMIKRETQKLTCLLHFNATCARAW